MKKLLKYSFLVLALTIGMSVAANAERWRDHHYDPDPPRHREDPEPYLREAPEVDPSLAIAGFSLLAGTLTVLRAQQGK